MKRKKVKLIYSVESYGCPSCGGCHNNPTASASSGRIAGQNTSRQDTSTNCPRR